MPIMQSPTGALQCSSRRVESASPRQRPASQERAETRLAEGSPAQAADAETIDPGTAGTRAGTSARTTAETSARTGARACAGPGINRMEARARLWDVRMSERGGAHVSRGILLVESLKVFEPRRLEGPKVLAA